MTEESPPPLPPHPPEPVQAPTAPYAEEPPVASIMSMIARSPTKARVLLPSETKETSTRDLGWRMVWEKQRQTLRARESFASIPSVPPVNEKATTTREDVPAFRHTTGESFASCDEIVDDTLGDKFTSTTDLWGEGFDPYDVSDLYGGRPSGVSRGSETGVGTSTGTGIGFGFGRRRGLKRPRLTRCESFDSVETDPYTDRGVQVLDGWPVDSESDNDSFSSGSWERSGSAELVLRPLRRGRNKCVGHIQPYKSKQLSTAPDIEHLSMYSDGGVTRPRSAPATKRCYDALGVPGPLMDSESPVQSTFSSPTHKALEPQPHTARFPPKPSIQLSPLPPESFYAADKTQSAMHVIPADSLATSESLESTPLTPRAAAAPRKPLAGRDSFLSATEQVPPNEYFAKDSFASDDGWRRPAPLMSNDSFASAEPIIFLKTLRGGDSFCSADSLAMLPQLRADDSFASADELVNNSLLRADNSFMSAEIMHQRAPQRGSESFPSADVDGPPARSVPTPKESSTGTAAASTSFMRESESQETREAEVSKSPSSQDLDKPGSALAETTVVHTRDRYYEMHFPGREWAAVLRHRRKELEQAAKQDVTNLLNDYEGISLPHNFTFSLFAPSPDYATLLVPFFEVKDKRTAQKRLENFTLYHYPLTWEAYFRHRRRSEGPQNYYVGRKSLRGSGSTRESDEYSSESGRMGDDEGHRRSNEGAMMTAVPLEADEREIGATGVVPGADEGATTMTAVPLEADEREIGATGVVPGADEGAMTMTAVPRSRRREIGATGVVPGADEGATTMTAVPLEADEREIGATGVVPGADEGAMTMTAVPRSRRKGDRGDRGSSRSRRGSDDDDGRSPRSRRKGDRGDRGSSRSRRGSDDDDGTPRSGRKGGKEKDKGAASPHKSASPTSSTEKKSPPARPVAEPYAAGTMNKIMSDSHSITMRFNGDRWPLILRDYEKQCIKTATKDIAKKLKSKPGRKQRFELDLSPENHGCLMTIRFDRDVKWKGDKQLAESFKHQMRPARERVNSQDCPPLDPEPFPYPKKSHISCFFFGKLWQYIAPKYRAELYTASCDDIEDALALKNVQQPVSPEDLHFYPSKTGLKLFYQMPNIEVIKSKIAGKGSSALRVVYAAYKTLQTYPFPRTWSLYRIHQQELKRRLAKARAKKAKLKAAEEEEKLGKEFVHGDDDMDSSVLGSTDGRNALHTDGSDDSDLDSMMAAASRRGKKGSEVQLERFEDGNTIFSPQSNRSTLKAQRGAEDRPTLSPSSLNKRQTSPHNAMSLYGAGSHMNKPLDDQDNDLDGPRSGALMAQALTLPEPFGTQRVVNATEDRATMRLYGDKWSLLVRDYLPECEKAAEKDVATELHTKTGPQQGFKIDVGSDAQGCLLTMHFDRNVRWTEEEIQAWKCDRLWELYGNAADSYKYDMRPARARLNSADCPELDKEALKYDKNSYVSCFFLGKLWKHIAPKYRAELYTAACDDIEDGLEKSGLQKETGLNMHYRMPLDLEDIKNSPLSESQMRNSYESLTEYFFPRVWSLYRMHEAEIKRRIADFVSAPDEQQELLASARVRDFLNSPRTNAGDDGSDATTPFSTLTASRKKGMSQSESNLESSLSGRQKLVKATDDSATVRLYGVHWPNVLRDYHDECDKAAGKDVASELRTKVGKKQGFKIDLDSDPKGCLMKIQFDRKTKWSEEEVAEWPYERLWELYGNAADSYKYDMRPARARLNSADCPELDKEALKYDKNLMFPHIAPKYRAELYTAACDDIEDGLKKSGLQKEASPQDIHFFPTREGLKMHYRMPLDPKDMQNVHISHQLMKAYQSLTEYFFPRVWTLYRIREAEIKRRIAAETGSPRRQQNLLSSSEVGDYLNSPSSPSRKNVPSNTDDSSKAKSRGPRPPLRAGQVEFIDGAPGEVTTRFGGGDWDQMVKDFNILLKTALTKDICDALGTERGPHQGFIVSIETDKDVGPGGIIKIKFDDGVKGWSNTSVPKWNYERVWDAYKRIHKARKNQPTKEGRRRLQLEECPEFDTELIDYDQKTHVRCFFPGKHWHLVAPKYRAELFSAACNDIEEGVYKYARAEHEVNPADIHLYPTTEGLRMNYHVPENLQGTASMPVALSQKYYFPRVWALYLLRSIEFNLKSPKKKLIPMSTETQRRNAQGSATLHNYDEEEGSPFADEDGRGPKELVFEEITRLPQPTSEEVFLPDSFPSVQPERRPLTQAESFLSTTATDDQPRQTLQQEESFASAALSEQRERLQTAESFRSVSGMDQDEPQPLNAAESFTSAAEVEAREKLRADESFHSADPREMRERLQTAESFRPLTPGRCGRLQTAEEMRERLQTAESFRSVSGMDRSELVPLEDRASFPSAMEVESRENLLADESFRSADPSEKRERLQTAEISADPREMRERLQTAESFRSADPREMRERLQTAESFHSTDPREMRERLQTAESFRSVSGMDRSELVPLEDRASFPSAMEVESRENLLADESFRSADPSEKRERLQTAESFHSTDPNEMREPLRTGESFPSGTPGALRESIDDDESFESATAYDPQKSREELLRRESFLSAATVRRPDPIHTGESFPSSGTALRRSSTSPSQRRQRHSTATILSRPPDLSDKEPPPPSILAPPSEPPGFTAVALSKSVHATDSFISYEVLPHRRTLSPESVSFASVVDPFKKLEHLTDCLEGKQWKELLENNRDALIRAIREDIANALSILLTKSPSRTYA
eukprot:gene10641-7389_t